MTFHGLGKSINKQKLTDMNQSCRIVISRVRAPKMQRFNTTKNYGGIPSQLAHTPPVAGRLHGPMKGTSKLAKLAGHTPSERPGNPCTP